MPEELSIQQQTKCMKIVGSLLFLSTRSCPRDIAFAVNFLTLCMKKAFVQKLTIAFRILKYIYRTKVLSLTFNGSEGIIFFAMVDSPFASQSVCPNTVSLFI